ncbi:MAG: hypothetical protein A3A43_02950 [Candidatus Liptonbacteria bacterium RIFCSPLOWO2_01_FULL_56_20]|uniref:Redox-regulated ATPase YchF n=1 Tax=Candidatus Liptonbacteria bacterium RIFCSPLOWO2_01_FULL_56_20 TaxID=1798652 RepID=A0A1G2CIG8_9BACT|nr:MAG: hypothetical protein A2681_00080 [Candidatus Liptonbacteria bacterium RIFCSPHIGHO2_01_FULL_56_18b]OGZ01002.1 MAG: hypothetical protein A3A43_02950 [Candidatus Liptonbacteria bacterium RIFCSPLOWO2_01_FULL_56_20]
MKLSIGIVGLPNVGKSTLFNLLTKQSVLAANYPFATIDPNVGVVAVPDERVDTLAEMSKSKKKIPAVVEFYDIAGLVKGAYKGEGLGNQFLAHIREAQAIVVVLRVFNDPGVVHVESTIDPLRDMGTINTELALKDLETVNKRLDKAEGEARTGDKKAIKNMEVLKTVKAELEKGNLIHQFGEEEIVREMQLLTSKKQLYLLNGDEADVSARLEAEIKKLGADYLVANLAAIKDLGELIKKAYAILDLISFLTTGEDETRAWTIKRGTRAPEAAGVIHTDFEKNFIRAEVVNWKKLLESGGWSQAKQKGLIRLEGKEYVVQDGDVMVVRHG